MLWLCGQAVGQEMLPPREWGKVRSFLCQLQNLDLDSVRASTVDLVIMDYSADGTGAGRYTREELRRLRGTGSRRKLLLAYLSVGEAEDYRFYWPGRGKARRAGWLGPLNNQWAGNYLARFWEPAWHSIMKEYLHQILEAGFDGVYLDRIDAYQEVQADRDFARREMLRLVAEVARQGREGGGADFGVFVQNAEELLDDPAYLSLVTGVGREEVYFAAHRDRSGIPQKNTPALEEALDRVVAAGKLVLSLDYPKDAHQAAWARERATARGYLHFAGLRSLDKLPNW